MELLLEYRRITKEQEDVKENHMSCIKNLLDFYDTSKYPILNIKYLRRLSELHEECKHWAEASFTILQYAQLLKWDNTPLSDVHKWDPSNTGVVFKTHMELKEALYNKVTQMFNEGEMWEEALEICKEISNVYEKETFEFTKMATSLKGMAGFYDNIMNKTRHENNYFRVGFYGRGFPAFLQNKVFIFRGRLFESLADFKSRISDQYPNAEMMIKMDPPTEEQKQGKEQLLQIIIVDPIVEERPEFKGRNVHPKILQHYKKNQVSKFVYERPYHHPKKNKENEFASLWIDQTIMETTEKFPGMLQWFPLVKEPDVMSLCPLEVAIKTIRKANVELKELVLSYDDEKQPLNPLTMRLNGTIDAAVNGGTANYEKAFFTDEYLHQNPTHEDRINELKSYIADQIPLLSIAVAIHEEKISTDANKGIRPLHDRLAGMFKTMKADVESKYGEGACDLDLKRFSMVSKISQASSETPPTNRESCDSYENNSNTLRRPLHTSNVSLMNGTIGDESGMSQRSSNNQYLSVSDQQSTRVSQSGYSDRVSEYMRIGIRNVGGKKGERRGSKVKDRDVKKLNLKGVQGYNNGISEESSPAIGNKSLFVPGQVGGNRPSSGNFLSSTPNHSRSPSNSNRGSMTSNDGSFYEQQLSNPPPVPPKHMKSNMYAEEDSNSLVSVEENNFINHCQNEMNNASKSLSQEYIVDIHTKSGSMVRHSKKKAPPPPPPLIELQDGAKTPPTPPKKPPIKLPID